MKRQLIVMRHGKSSWADETLTDHQRPLNKRGCRDAPRVAARLAELGWAPQQVLSSDAARTRETCQLLCETIGGEIPAAYLGELYHGGTDAIREAVAALPDELATALVLGHNPGLEEAIQWLTGETIEMTTANAALLVSEHSRWCDTVHECKAWTLYAVLRPKEL
jgi:phosphohistidine phosphatase